MVFCLSTLDCGLADVTECYLVINFFFFLVRPLCSWACIVNFFFGVRPFFGLSFFGRGFVEVTKCYLVTLLVTGLSWTC